MSRPIPRARVEKILRACVAYRNPARIPGQTEQLCLALIRAWADLEEVAKASARYVASHRFQAVRLQGAEDKSEYVAAAKALDEALEPWGYHEDGAAPCCPRDLLASWRAGDSR